MRLINLSSNLRRWVNTTTPDLQRTRASCGRPQQSAQSRDRSRDSWSPGLSRLSRPHLTFLFLDLVWKVLLSPATSLLKCLQAGVREPRGSWNQETDFPGGLHTSTLLPFDICLSCNLSFLGTTVVLLFIKWLRLTEKKYSGSSLRSL